MTDQTEPIDRMREDFVEVVRDRRANGLWTADDETEIGNLIKAAVQGASGDMSLLECWQRWLAREAEEIRQWRSRVRDVEKRIHAEAKAARVRECA